MPKGKRTPLKKIKHAPPPRSDEEVEFDPAFNSIQDRVKLKRQAFCREYVKDFNASNAMRRLGYQSAQPWVRGSEWLREPYTQWFLAKMMAELDDKTIITRNTVTLGLLKEANYHGEDGGSASRIAAFRALAKILGLEITKVEGNLVLNGGVMAVPMCNSLEEWEAATKLQQSKLKKEVRV